MLFEQRTNTCGELRAADIGKSVVLNGWVHRKRDHGGITFINIRDRYGVTQVVVDADSPRELLDIAADLKMEYCLSIRGTVRPRPDTMVNPSMPTGEIEVKAERIQILSRCAPLPFMIDESTDAKEDMRLTYRYLDLRSFSMQKKIRLRHEAAFAVREYLVGNGFYEIETPTFIRSTPEGARDYLVPSRLYPGKFYALPQSPQLYKQILMVSGFDKYFQLARCYRDEDSRGDRQPEFTQIDIEMSFVTREDVLTLVEGLMGHVFKKTLGVQLPAQFVRIPYDEALDRFGTDKPDLRFGMELQDFAPFVDEHCSFQAFHEVVTKGGTVKALVVPGKADYSRKQIEELEAKAKVYKAHGLAWMKVSPAGVLEGGASKFFSDHARIIQDLGAKPGDLILLVADEKKKIACTALGAVRTQLGKDIGLCDRAVFAFAWIVDFPLFEYNEEEQRWEAAHHMFTMPQAQYHDSLEADPGAVKGDLYDLVLNGYEIASGSIRIHDPELQKRIFRIVGMTDEEAQRKFGFLLEAFKYGPPPHGGIAPGFDRLVMLMAGETSIKEVIAFPKNSFAVSPMDQCPNEVDERQLKELHIKIEKEE
ncbi:Aspartate--tRNA ligase [uncultured spirochete]|jgi:aspartyl-tRNA synthetase|uniref:Aspartate--tRNA(Asp/Asn) ligase n=1 Tax=uncultured spirochete TaxID=156406 RepID=A0A3P3XKG9_9SPIR|nr:aspartate--tRNA ligase [Rectinema subterraneum]SLM14587.1 Aspartate--tRNA ligase [uncultured spirochete]